MTKANREGPNIIVRLLRRWFIDALGAMALGLFASLIIGLIITQLSKISFLSWMGTFAQVLDANSPVIGAAIGVAVAAGLKAAPLAIYSSAATGALGYVMGGGPVGAFLAALVGAELGNLIAGRIKLRLDILLVPFVTIVSGGLVAQFIGPPISGLMTLLGDFINTATTLQPIPMGIIVSTVVGMALTAPISSAALCIMLGLNGLAAGAATVGCCVNMVGFAIISYRDNGIGGSLAQGLGTSMLQVPNIVRKPLIWLPAILSSAVLGPIATTLMKIENNMYGAGMGTSGLVGPINAYIAMTQGGADAWMSVLKIVIMLIVLPAFITLLIYWPFKKFGWIKSGDMRLEL